jgi:hypothetical protein
MSPAEQQLYTYYMGLEVALREQLAEAVRDGWEWRRSEALLVQVRRELETLELKAQGWDAAQIPAAYTLGTRRALEQINQAAPGYLRGDEAAVWSRLPTDALQKLAEEASKQRAPLFGSILRQSEDFLRSLASGELAKGLGLGKSAQDVGRAIRDGSIMQLQNGAALQKLAGMVDQAVGVVYSDGSVHSLHSYGMMAGRTGLMTAMNQATTDRYQEAGIHLFDVSNHGTLCFLCKPVEGCTFALDEEGVKQGYPLCPVSIPVHPNCQHSKRPRILAVQGEGQKATDLAWADNREKYRTFRDQHDDLYQGARRGFGNEYQLKEAMQQHPGVPIDELKGPRWRAPGIEQKRLNATAEMLKNPDLTYAQAMARQGGVTERPTPPSRRTSDGQPPSPPAVGTSPQAIMDHERDILPLRYERAVVLDAHGDVVLNKDGQTASVSFTPDEISHMEHGYFTHNHPVSGGSFSPEDMLFASHANVAEIRAVGAFNGVQRTHVATRPEGGWPTVDDIRNSYARYRHEVHQEYQAKLLSGEITIDYAETNFYHEVWVRACHDLGIPYQREPWA